MVLGSLLLHALVLALLLFSIPHVPEQEPPAPPSFEIVTDGGAATPRSTGQASAPPAVTPGTTAPEPGENPLPSPSASVPAPASITAPPPPAPIPAPEPPQPAPPAPETPPEAPPAPQVQAETPPAPPQVQVPPPALPEAEPLPEPPIPPVTLPTPTPSTPTPPTPTPPVPPRPRPRPTQLARPHYRPAPQNPSGFPAPQDWSLGGGLPSHPSRQGAPSGQAELAGPSQPAPRITGAQLGRDWIAAYSAWVQAHLYYPEQAALNGEDGTAEVVLDIDRYGKVLSVELVTRSGSQWLDLSTQGIFRGAHVPAFPQGTKEETATIDQTIHYILTRR
jgi:periplasmic protein TonB